jgi:CheY-like chemotaxis protein
LGFDSSLAALQALRAQPQRFDLVLTDETIPNLTGTELARGIRQSPVARALQALSAGFQLK